MEQSQFFCTYVLVAGAGQLFFRFSQVQSILLFLLLQKTTLKESKSQRRLDEMHSKVFTFPLFELIPLFLFIFMVGALYGALAPLSCFFVAAFFLTAERVFRYMTVYVYGSLFEAGGTIMYTLNTILFGTLYLVAVIICSYLGSHGSTAMGGIFSLQIFVIASVHHEINKKFVLTSKSLSLVKAHSSDETSDGLTPFERKKKAVVDAQKNLEEYTLDESKSESMGTSEREQAALLRIQNRYQEKRRGSMSTGEVSDVTESHASGDKNDFFIYRQPSLNRATWEVAPRSYRCRQRQGDHRDMSERIAETWH